MAEKSSRDIPRPIREQFEKGLAAFQRQNFDYAIDILNQVLLKEPAFYECREVLRAAQFKKAAGGSGFFKKVFGTASASSMVAKAQIALRNKPLEAIHAAEQILNSDPGSAAAHRLLADAAMTAGLPKTAVLSLEILWKNSPHDQNLTMQLGQALAAAGQVARAEGMYSELLRASPNNQELAQALKHLSALKTMQEGGYDALADGKGSYRDILKNKEEAISIEQEKREVKSEDVAERLIAEYKERLEREPDNLKLIRSIAELSTQKKDFEQALEFYGRLRTSEAGKDPSLDRAIADVHLRRFDQEIASLDPSLPDYAGQLAKLQAEREAYQLNECKERAERYPTDSQIRFELGQLYFHAGRVGEAILEFQRSQSNPHLRIPSLGFLGQCFARRGINDLASRTLQNALKEKVVFDDEKKELHYLLGCVLEKMGKVEEAIEQFKLIYEVDIGYKDVMAKVDTYYSSRS